MGEVEDSDGIGHLLSQVCRLERRRIHQLLHEVGLYRGQYAILRALWQQDGLTQTDLVQRSHVRAATISKTAQRMAEAGLVERRRNDRDQRVSRVYLTEKGRALQNAAEGARRRLEEEAFVGLLQADRAALRASLGHVRDNLLLATSQGSDPQKRRQHQHSSGAHGPDSREEG